MNLGLGKASRTHELLREYMEGASAHPQPMKMEVQVASREASPPYSSVDFAMLPHYCPL